MAHERLIGKLSWTQYQEKEKTLKQPCENTHNYISAHSIWQKNKGDMSCLLLVQFDEDVFTEVFHPDGGVSVVVG